MIKNLKVEFGNAALQKYFYFSGGAGSQYKNKFNFSSILSHKSECGIEAEWHFFATSHGKGACDGNGGCVKNAARIASLQISSQNQITSPKRLFDWAVNYYKYVSFYFCII